MKHHNFLRGAAFALVAVLNIGAVQAASISGALSFGGEVVSDPGPGLENATGLAFVTGIGVVDATGDFAADGTVFGTVGTISDFVFNLVSPVTLLTVGSFSFSLESVEIIDQAVGFLVLAGTGTLSGAGFDDTAYNISLSADSVGGLNSFSGTLGPAAVVPVPGALLLFMSGLAALGVRRRN